MTVRPAPVNTVPARMVTVNTPVIVIKDMPEFTVNIVGVNLFCNTIKF